MSILHHLLRAACCACLPAALAAEPITVSTVPMGGMVVEVPSGISVLSDSFLAAPQLQGRVSDVTEGGNGLFIEGAMSEIQLPAYVHVLGGAHEGMISTVTSVNGDFLVLESPLDLMVGDTVAVRSHRTVGQLFNADFADGTTLTVVDLNGIATTLNFYPNFGWYDNAFNEQDDFILFPGEATVFFSPAADPVPVLISGVVNTNPLKVPFSSLIPARISGLNPVSGFTLAEIFGDTAVDGASVTLRQNIGGVYTLIGSYTFYENFGFYDEFFNEANDVPIPISGGVFYFPAANSGFVTLPPAYTETEIP